MYIRALFPLFLLQASFAQDVLPTCGQTCIDDALDLTTCAVGRYDCLCADSSFINYVAECLVASCTSDLVTTSVAAAAALCESQTGESNEAELSSAVQSVSSTVSVSEATTTAALTSQTTASAMLSSTSSQSLSPTASVSNTTTIRASSVSPSSRSASSSKAVASIIAIQTSTSGSAHTRGQSRSGIMYTGFAGMPALGVLFYTRMWLGQW